MKTIVLDFFGDARRIAASLRARYPNVDRRHAAALAAALPVFFMGPYVIPFMLALLFFGGVMAAYFALAARVGAHALRAAVPPAAMLPFVGIVSPVEHLPNWMQIVAHLFPVTYIVEGVRTLATFGAFDGAAFVASVLLSAMYLFFLYLWGEAYGTRGAYDTVVGDY